MSNKFIPNIFSNYHLVQKNKFLTFKPNLKWEVSVDLDHLLFA